MIASLASIALSPWAVGAGVLIAILATLGLAYIKAPPSLVAIVWLVFAAHLYSGTIWQTATEACEARTKAAVDAERTRQRDVADRTVDAAIEREKAAQKAADDAEQKVADYEETLRRRPAAACTLDADDIRALRMLQ